MGNVVSYKGIDFEPRAYRESGNAEKKLMYFNNSLDRLNEAGYECHLQPAQAMQFLAAGLEGSLNPIEEELFDDMRSEGEWLSAAVQVVQRGQSQILETYIDPNGLVHYLDDYIVPEIFKCSDKQEFDITGILPSPAYVDMNKLPDEFVRLMYGRSFAELPKEMREGDQRAQIYLPAYVRGIFPIGRGGFKGRFTLVISHVVGASRGARTSSTVAH